MKSSTSCCIPPPPTHPDCTAPQKFTKKTILSDQLLITQTPWAMKLLTDLLNPLIGNTEHHVKNSKDLTDELSEVCIEDNEMFNSRDVVSLFTNTPIKQSLDIIEKWLMDDKDLKKRTKLSVQDIVELLEFILTTTYFEFRGGIYRHRFGAAMGSPVSPIVANLFMEFLEQHAIATAPMDCWPRLWKRYVDDILEIKRDRSKISLTISIKPIPLIA